MEGYEPNWVSTTTPTKARYVRLPVGHYTFKVQASNSDGVWNNVGAQINLSVEPPWWRTYKAYVAYALILWGIVYLFIQVKHYQKQITRVEREKEKIAKTVEQEYIVLNNKSKVYLSQLKYIKSDKNYLKFGHRY